MTFNEAVKCLKDNKCKFIYREAWGSKKIDNRIKYNSFDVCLEFDINNKIYYAKDVEDILANDWTAFDTVKETEEIIRYVSSLKASSVYSNIDDLRRFDPDYSGTFVELKGTITKTKTIEESNFYKCYYGVNKEDIITEMVNLLDRISRIIVPGKLERDIEKTLRKVSNGDLK